MESESALEKFLRPWHHPNELGILEVPLSDIQIGDYIGSGGKATTRKAVWKGQEIALKAWHADGCGPYSQWEISRYCDLKLAQGSLIPKLFFVSRDDDGDRMLGLELGSPVSDHDEGVHEAMKQLDLSLQGMGWKQRKASWRSDNVVWIKNNDGSKRLVAIDLESFIPHFEDTPLVPRTTDKLPCLGLPYVSPAEVLIKNPNANKDFEWVASRYSPVEGLWGDIPVVIVSFTCSFEFERCLEKNSLLKELQGTLIARPLFVSRQRNGTLLFGCEQAGLRPRWTADSQLVRESKKRTAEEFEKLGWCTAGCPIDNYYVRGKDTELTCILMNLKGLKQVQADTDCEDAAELVNEI